MAGPSKTATTTPAPPASLKKSTSSSKNQTSIAGFFRKKDPEASTNGTPKINGSALPVTTISKTNGSKIHRGASSQSLTPALSSDAAEEIQDEEDARSTRPIIKQASNGLPSPITPASVADQEADDAVPKGFYSPSRKVYDYLCSFCNGGLQLFPRQRKLSTTLLMPHPARKMAMTKTSLILHHTTRVGVELRSEGRRVSRVTKTTSLLQVPRQRMTLRKKVRYSVHLIGSFNVLLMLDFQMISLSTTIQTKKL